MENTNKMHAFNYWHILRLHTTTQLVYMQIIFPINISEGQPVLAAVAQFIFALLGGFLDDHTQNIYISNEI